jgi:DNA repair exonuclease SbcCD ATPase subunit
MSDALSIVSDKETETPKESPLETFFKNLEGVKEVEARIKSCLEYMQDALAKGKIPDFKGFWEVRKHCLPFFKESMAQPVRTTFWDTYIELTREGRRLKHLLDEESSFAVEQIDLALQALEKELTDLEEGNATFEKGVMVELPDQPKSFQREAKAFESLQTRLNALNLIATQITSLRKELVKTQMRVRHKNKFFNRLSALGDRVFPARKELIKEVSEKFEKSVQNFVNHNFSANQLQDDQLRRTLFQLREEIKALQSMAKVFTLNTHAFTSTRKTLSECWDQLRGKEKEFRKEFSEQKQRSHECVKQIEEKIESFTSKERLSCAEAYQELDEILNEMKALDLTRQDFAILKEKLQELRAPFDQQRVDEENARKEQQQAAEKDRRTQVEMVIQEVEAFIAQADGKELSELLEYSDAFPQKISSLQLHKSEKLHFDRLQRSIREKLSQKKEQAVLSLSSSDQEALGGLKGFIDEKKEERKTIKKQLEEYRKLVGGSNLDFEQAIKYNELLAQEKERLEKCDASIQELEQKISELKKKAENL